MAGEFDLAAAEDATAIDEEHDLEQQAGLAAQIEADIERTRDRLAVTVDALAERVKPANIARRAVASVKAEFVDEQGNLRTTRVAALAAVTAAGVGLVLWRRSR